MESTFSKFFYHLNSWSGFGNEYPLDEFIRSRDYTYYEIDDLNWFTYAVFGEESLLGAASVIALHWLAYCVATALLISVLARSCVDFSSLFSLSRVSGVDTWLTAAALCSMAGVPPFIGFWTKASLLVVAGCGSSLWLSIACWAISVSGLLFYVGALRYSVSLRKLNELEADSTLAEGADGFSLVVAASLVAGSLLLGDAALLTASLFI